MAGLSADTIAQIIASSVIGLIAVIGSIGGAILGAKQGAEATLTATKQSIDADKEAATEAEQRQARAVRLMLSSEIDANLAAVRTSWQFVLARDGSNEAQDADDQDDEPTPKPRPLDKYDLARRVVRTRPRHEVLKRGGEHW